MNKLAVIKLTGKRGGYTLVDRADYERLNQSRWQKDANGYVRRCTSSHGVRRTVWMHKEVLDAPEVDHKNGLPVDNTRANLRPCNRAQTCANRAVQSNVKTSCFKGVHKQGDKWRARITLNGRTYSLGMFATQEEAARAYNEKAPAFYGDFARPNDL